MCLILLAWHAHPDYPLVIAANRDEFHDRATALAQFWDDAPNLLAGRDLKAGGTWLGVTRNGRFAALTNYRDPARGNPHTTSRGELVSEFLSGDMSADDYLRHLQQSGSSYNGFNLIFSDGKALAYYSNCGDQPRILPPGVYGLSNHLLDTPWPKVAQGKSALAKALDALPDDRLLLELLHDERQASDAELPRTGVSLEWERLLSAAFISSSAYGTRSSTVVVVNRAGSLRFEEISWSADSSEQGRVSYSFEVAG